MLQTMMELSDKQAISLEFLLEGLDFDRAGEASSKIKTVLRQIGIRADITRRISIGAYEAELNVIIHAVRGRMTVRILPDRTEIMAVDEGPGIEDIDQAMKEGYSTAPDYIREMGFGAGMGLPNMKRCADEFRILSQVGAGTQIRMVFHH